MRHHRLDDVGHADDPRLKADLVALRALWIAGAVETLVMLQDCCCHGPRHVYILHDVVARLAVRFDQRILSRSEFARPRQNLGGNLDLADVVDQARHIEAVDAFFRQL